MTELDLSAEVLNLVLHCSFISAFEATMKPFYLYRLYLHSS
jgi:hypothetical protein